ncbi:MAG: class I SAM-dependent methyltransferase [Fuerstiella sp.]
MTETDKSCWVCSSTSVHATIRYNDWQVYRCRDCGFRFAEDGQPLVYDEHYDEDYFAPLMQRDQMDKWSRIYAERLNYLKQHAPSPVLLEAGAGASTFALNAVDHGFQVSVVDAAPWAVGFLSGHDGISGTVTDLNNCQLPAQKFGAIHCSHVLEHLSNPKSFLSQCHQSLQDGGLMYLSFPAYEGRVLAWRDSLYHLGLANHPYNYQAPDHLSYFDADCIRRTLQNVGFEVVRLRRIKFISVYDAVARMSHAGPLRRTVGLAAKLTGPLSRRIGFHRDLEIIARRPGRTAQRESRAA